MIIAMHKQLLLTLADVRFVTVGCQHCTTKVTIDLKEKSEYAEKFNILLANQCPGCRKNYDSAVGHALTALQQACDALAAVGKYISFQVVEENALSSKQ